MKAKDFTVRFYLDWMNNYITVKKIAEDHGISVDLAHNLINEGRRVHNISIERANESLISLRK